MGHFVVVVVGVGEKAYWPHSLALCISGLIRIESSFSELRKSSLLSPTAVCFISDASSSELIHFIVDSGSDVVTVPETVIAKLHLEHLRNVESRGAHSAADKPLYRGVIKLGSEEFVVEVGDEYE